LANDAIFKAINSFIDQYNIEVTNVSSDLGRNFI
jgi:flagellar capping protein FliD